MVEYNDDNNKNKKNAHPSFANNCANSKQKQREGKTKRLFGDKQREDPSHLSEEEESIFCTTGKFTILFTLLCYFGISGKELWALEKRVRVNGGVASVREGGVCWSEATFKCCSFNVTNSTLKWTKLKYKFDRDWLQDNWKSRFTCLSHGAQPADMLERWKTGHCRPQIYKHVLKLPCETHSRTEHLHHQQQLTFQRQAWQLQGLSWAPLDAVCVYLMVIWELIRPDF